MQRWNARKWRKPLIIRGARQVGKTWLLKEFGANEYGQVVYINFDNSQRIKNYLKAVLEAACLVTGLELYAGNKIDPSNTLTC